MHHHLSLCGRTADCGHHSKMPSKVRSSSFYATYHGHEREHLAAVMDSLRGVHHRTAIFLAGDSSLDNKFWFNDACSALNGYEHVLEPPLMKPDLAYWLNELCVRRRRPELFCINTAVEASSLNSRALGKLLHQDCFIRDNITAEDYLIVSVGGNDLALAPLLATVLNLVPLLCLTPIGLIRRGEACPPNLHVDCGCYGCGLPGCIVSPCGCPPGLAYFVDLFGNRVENYVRRLIGETRPKKVLVCMIYNTWRMTHFSHMSDPVFAISQDSIAKKQVIVCMIYYLDVHGRGSWADCFLSLMGYNVAPQRLQAAIKRLFELGTRRIRIPRVCVEAVPLFETLDGNDSSDYVQRVEPSPSGGAKLASALMDVILGADTHAEADGYNRLLNASVSRE